MWIQILLVWQKGQIWIQIHSGWQKNGNTKRNILVWQLKIQIYLGWQKRANMNMNTNIQTGIRKYKYKYKYSSNTGISRLVIGFYTFTRFLQFFFSKLQHDFHVNWAHINIDRFMIEIFLGSTKKQLIYLNHQIVFRKFNIFSVKFPCLS